jgi:hypothetical protein
MYFNKINQGLFLLLLSFTFIYATCRKHPIDCSNTIYNFELGIKAYPVLDSIHINDTIWVEINDSTILKDVQTGREINYEGATNLGAAIGFQKYSGSTSQFTISAADKFAFFVARGTNVLNTMPELYKEYFFTQESGRYVFKLAIIPKETGVFRFVFSNASGVVRKNDNCTKAFFTLNFKNTNQHFYLFPGGANTPPGGGAYYFKVY